jgi:fatty-acyl-CoA synthase
MGETLWTRWNEVAEADPEREAVVWVRAGEDSVRWTYAGLLEEGRRRGAWLKGKGVRRGDVCAIILRHHPLFYPIYVGIEAIGAVPAVLAYPNQRLHDEKFRQGLRGMARESGLDWLLTERDLQETLRSLTASEKGTIRGILLPLEATQELGPLDLEERPAAGSNEPCLLQHSSGTTGLQKAVVLSHRAVLDHVALYGRAIGLSHGDKIVSWLPLYHDMGLIASFHLPLSAGVTSVHLDPFEWVQAPILLLEQISNEGGTLTWLPNFAYNLMADRVPDEEMEGMRLDSLRMAVNCSELVRAESHDRFLKRFEPYGLKASALAACYAMAETTFAVTQTRPIHRAHEIVLDREALARGRVEPALAGRLARRCVSSGTVIEGCEVEIVSEGGAPADPGQVGEILVRSRSLFDGYRNQPEKTAAVLARGRYQSGDLGFLADGELFVVGRRKDLVVVAGKNIYPEDVEDAVGAVEGILPGRVVAFGEDDPELGTERLAVIAESEVADPEARSALRRRVIEAGMRVDVAIVRVYLVPPRWLIKSSAGKPSRKTNRERVAGLPG